MALKNFLLALLSSVSFSCCASQPEDMQQLRSRVLDTIKACEGGRSEAAGIFQQDFLKVAYGGNIAMLEAFDPLKYHFCKYIDTDGIAGIFSYAILQALCLKNFGFNRQDALRVVACNDEDPEQEKKIHLLLQYGANVRIGDAWWAPLMCALQSKSLNGVGILLKAGAGVNTPFGLGPREENFLHTAVGCGFVQGLQALLENEASPNGSFPYDTPLGRAVCSAHEKSPEMIVLLCKYGASDSKIVGGKSLLEMAARLQMSEDSLQDQSLRFAKCSALLAKYLDDHGGGTVWHALAHEDRILADDITPIAMLFSRQGVSCEDRDKNGKTPLEVCSGSSELALFLKKKTADKAACKAGV